jgi:hypothetical protein
VGILASLFGEKNPIESLPIDELKISEIQLKKKIENIHAEIHRSELEEERLTLFGQATDSKSENCEIIRTIANSGSIAFNLQSHHYKRAMERSPRECQKGVDAYSNRKDGVLFNFNADYYKKCR